MKEIENQGANTMVITKTTSVGMSQVNLSALIPAELAVLAAGLPPRVESSAEDIAARLAARRSRATDDARMERKYVNRLDGKACGFISEIDGVVTFKWEGSDTPRYLGIAEFEKRFGPEDNTPSPADLVEEAAMLIFEAMWFSSGADAPLWDVQGYGEMKDEARFVARRLETLQTAAPAPELLVTGFRGNPLRVVLSSGHEATVTQKLIDAFASPSPFDHAEPEPDAIEAAYRNGFTDGAKEFSDNLQHAQETVRGLQRILEELSEKQISKVVIDVIKERRRQMAVEGWTIEHDDQHQQSELVWAAACYALAGAPGNPAATVISQKDIPHALWPWALQWFKPTDRRRDLEKAGALIIAEIERLDRADAAFACPVCLVSVKPDDICATDIELGICHAECLEGVPVVDLDTGEPIPGGEVDTFRFGDTDPTATGEGGI